MTDKWKCSVFTHQVISQEMLHGHSLPWHAQPPLAQEPPHPREQPLGKAHTGNCQPWQRRVLLLLDSLHVQRVLVSFQGLILVRIAAIKYFEVGKVAVHIVVGPLFSKSSRIASFKLAMCLMSKWFKIWTLPAAPSSERVPSLAERVAYLRYSINLRLFNWRVPALLLTLQAPLN